MSTPARPPPPSRRPRYAQAFALALLALGEPAIARGAVEGGPAATAATATETDATTTVTIHLAVPPAADAGTPRVTRVTIDGRAASLDVPIEVTAGPHVVRLELEGRAADERTITVHAGDHVELALDGVIAPPREPPMLGGAPPPVQSRGGCAGCGGGHDASSATLGAGSLALGVVLAKGRRRRPRTARRSRS
jgi:hypothetical protein